LFPLGQPLGATDQAVVRLSHGGQAQHPRPEAAHAWPPLSGGVMPCSFSIRFWTEMRSALALYASSRFSRSRVTSSMRYLTMAIQPPGSAEKRAALASCSVVIGEVHTESVRVATQHAPDCTCCPYRTGYVATVGGKHGDIGVNRDTVRSRHVGVPQEVHGGPRVYRR